jgi:tRNA threonylcarbamoyladenosine biosynthesis protein TsaB
MLLKILAFESSTSRGTIALLSNEKLVQQLDFPAGQRTAQSFAPALDQLLREHLSSAKEIELVALTVGPGSFTGLRIAVTAAKTLAYATHAHIVALNTLDVLVQQLPTSVTRACAVMDAQRHQFFAAQYRRDHDETWVVTRPCHIVDQQALLQQTPHDMMLTGPGLKKLEPQSLESSVVSTPDVWSPQAATLGTLAWKRHLAEDYDDLWSVSPAYYRPSYAEEKREA